MVLGLSKLSCAGEAVLGKAGAVLIHDMLPFFSSSPVWLGKWSSPLQSPIQQPITHPHMEQPKSNQLKKMTLFSDLSCTFPALYLASPGLSGFAHSLVTHEHQQGLPDLVMHQGMQREASCTGASCLLSKAKPGSPATWSPTVGDKGCSAECSSLLW